MNKYTIYSLIVLALIAVVTNQKFVGDVSADNVNVKNETDQSITVLWTGIYHKDILHHHETKTVKTTISAGQSRVLNLPNTLKYKDQDLPLFHVSFNVDESNNDYCSKTNLTKGNVQVITMEKGGIRCKFS